MNSPSNDQSHEWLKFHGLWSDQNGDHHVSYVQENGHIKLYRTRSKELRRWIRREAYRFDGTILGDDAVEEIASYLDARCELEGGGVGLHPRVTWHNSRIYVDGVDTVYELDNGDWREVNPGVPLFLQYPTMKPLAKPVKGGDIKKILDFVNIGDALDQVLFLCHLAFSFVAGCPHPVLVFYGPQGSSKTSGMKRYLQIVDPNATADIHTYSEMEFQLAAIGRWCIALDNISGISSRFSDLLCKIVTGVGFTRRILYTTDEMMSHNYNRVVLVNGVTLPVDKPDLMDRCVLIALERIENDQRKDEATLMQEFDLVRGEILGGCFDVVCKAMQNMHSAPKHVDTRMTDFGRWGCVIAEAMGYDRKLFLAALERNTLRQNEESLDASPIAALLAFHFSKSNLAKLRGTATDILRELRSKSDAAGIDPRMVPQFPRTFGKKLMEIKPNLEREGYRISFDRGKERIWTIEPPSKVREDRLAHIATLTSQWRKASPSSTSSTSVTEAKSSGSPTLQ